MLKQIASFTHEKNGGIVSARPIFWFVKKAKTMLKTTRQVRMNQNNYTAVDVALVFVAMIDSAIAPTMSGIV